MGTPAKIREREAQCVGAGPCSEPRQLTEEEILKYYTKEEIEKMSKKIDPPEREKLIETLAKAEGKTKAIHHAARIFEVSTPVIYGWIKDYGIEFDAEGTVINKPQEFAELDKSMQDLAKVVVDNTIKEAAAQTKSPNLSADQIEGEMTVVINGEVVPIVIAIPTDNEDKSSSTITITGQETKEIRKKLGYAEHDIGNATIIYDFRADLVKIVTPSNNEMTPEVARAVAEDILDILGHE